MLFTLLIIIIALIALLLSAVVLLQSGQGGGLAGIAAGGATRQVLGARQAPDLLERATWTLATIFIVLCLLTNFVIGAGGEQESVIQQRAGQEQTQPVLPPAGEGEQAVPPPAGTEEQGDGTQPVPPPQGEDQSGSQ